MRKVRLLIVGAVLASSFLFVGASPASANCWSDPSLPVDPCVVVCSVGQSNKYTADLFRFCDVW